MSYARELSFTNDKYKDLIKSYDQDPKVDLGTLCRQHDLLPQDFLADINRQMYPQVDEAMNFARGLSMDIVAKRLPKVVERGMIEGAKADGITDRHFTLQKEGFHVTPKGMNINLQQNNATLSQGGMQSFEEQSHELNSILSGEPLELEAGDYVEAELTEDLREEIPA